MSERHFGRIKKNTNSNKDGKDRINPFGIIKTTKSKAMTPNNSRITANDLIDAIKQPTNSLTK